MGRLRLFLVLLMVDWAFGIPGVGVETRTGGNDLNDLMGWMYSVVGLALVVALALTWFRRAWAGPLAMAVGAIAVVLAIADAVGLTSGQPAPAAMLVVDVGGVVIGAAIVWAATRAGRSPALPA
jgi:hypothetical protein